MKLLNKIKNLFIKDNEPAEEHLHIEEIFNSDEYTEDVELIKLDMDNFPDPIIINKDKKKVLLLLDDIVESEYLFDIDFNNIEKLTHYNIHANFKIVKCYGKYAGFTAAKYLMDNPKVDYAILDITLGTSIKLKNGDYKEYDGVDIALEILNKNKKAKILFLTAHTFNKRNPLMKEYFNKFETNTGLHMEEYYLNKNEDRVAKYISFLNIKKDK